MLSKHYGLSTGTVDHTPIVCNASCSKLKSQTELNPAAARSAVGWDKLAGDDAEVRQIAAGKRKAAITGG